MKILQITPHFSPNIGGVETHLNDLVSALTERKHKVFVLTYQPLQIRTSWKIFEREKQMKVFRIPWIAGFFYKFVNKPILEFLYLFPGIFLAAPIIILFEKPKVLHAHGLVAGVVAVFWGKVFNIKSVISTHNIYNFPSSGLHRKLIDWIFNNVDSILCLSPQSAEEIKNIVEHKKKIGVFTSWVDLKKFKPRGTEKVLKRELGWSSKFTVLFVGRLVPEKGVGELLEAAKSWSKNINLTIVGSGVMEKKIMKFSAHHKNVSYLGKVSNEKLPTYYSASDLVIVPSTHEEGFGRVILESLACGTPVIGSKRGAIPLIMNETVGKLIDVNPESIKNAVEYFYENPNKLARAGKKARNFVESRYSSDNVESIIKSYSNRE